MYFDRSKVRLVSSMLSLPGMLVVDGYVGLSCVSARRKLDDKGEVGVVGSTGDSRADGDEGVTGRDSSLEGDEADFGTAEDCGRMTDERG